jgi:hypothetical protein
MNHPGHPKVAALVAATKLFTVGAAGVSWRPTAPPLNNFG